MTGSLRLAARPKRKTASERAEEFDAEQRRLKQEAAERREAAAKKCGKDAKKKSRLSVARDHRRSSRRRAGARAASPARRRSSGFSVAGGGPGRGPGARRVAAGAASGRCARGTNERSPAEARERFAVETAMISARPARREVEVTPVTAGGLPGAAVRAARAARRRRRCSSSSTAAAGSSGRRRRTSPACRLLAPRPACGSCRSTTARRPSTRFPAAVEDAHAAFLWAVEHAAVARRRSRARSRSAATAPAATSPRSSRAARATPAGRCRRSSCSSIPATDFSRPRRPSATQFGEGFLLTTDRMDWFEDHYVPDADGKRHPDASPLLADDLSGLPPAHVATAAADPLRDEGEEYAAKLREAGRAGDRPAPPAPARVLQHDRVAQRPTRRRRTSPACCSRALTR